MMEKVEITKEQAEQLEKLLHKRNGNKESILKDHTPDVEGWNEDYRSLNELSIYEMAQILLIGYTVKQTPKELIQSWYDRAVNSAGKDDNSNYTKGYHVGYLTAIENVVELLGLDVKVKVRGGGKTDYSDLFR